MSYDLVFWRQLDSVTTPPASIYEQLLQAGRVEGLTDLDVDSMLERLSIEFPGAIREPNGPSEWVSWTSPNQEDSFQVEWTSQAMIASCRHLHSDDMNRIIDWAASYGCPLFDPQTNERFDGTNR